MVEPRTTKLNYEERCEKGVVFQLIVECSRYGLVRKMGNEKKFGLGMWLQSGFGRLSRLI